MSMTTRRRTVLLSLPPLLAGCAGGGREGREAAEGTARRFAAALDGAEDARGRADRAHGRLRAAGGGRGGGHRLRPGRTVRGGARGELPSRFTPAPAGAADAAGRLLDTAFAAWRTTPKPWPRPPQASARRRRGPERRSLARSAEAALAALAATAAARSGSGAPAGLGAIAALADLPQTLARSGRRTTESALVAEAQPHVAAIAALLRAAVGTGPGQGARGAIATRQSALDASQSRLLAAVRSDSRIGPTARYSVFRSVANRATTTRTRARSTPCWR